jgi:hypothetical protein
MRVDARGVHREGALHADAVRGLADGEHLAVPAAAAARHGALEDLDALLVALDHADVDAYRVTRLEGGTSLRSCSASILSIGFIDSPGETEADPSSGRRAAGQE